MKEVKKMAKRKEELPAPGAPAWTATFGDLMNLLLCFFVMLFAMSTVDSEKFKAIAESFSKTFSIFEGGATSIGDGLLISNGVSQLNDLDQYVNNTGKTEEGKDDPEKIDNYTEMKDKLEEAQLNESEQLAEKIDESVAESNMTDKIDITFTSQYVQLTLKGALLFDSGKTEIRAEAVPVVDKVGRILENYAGNVIEIEGHTDNVPMHSAKYANNSELSCGRALAVYDYLISTTNLDPSKIKYAGRGEYVPVADNSTEEGRAKNRRVEIRIYHDLSTYE
jgi:chemotaxis protein MotB